jgi:tRNA (guanine9-N1)-methyltransferase
MSDDEKSKVPLADAAAPPAKRSKRPPLSVASGPRIIMDMNWSECMNEYLQRKVISQVTVAYSFNRGCPTSLPMLFTSVGPLWEELLGRLKARHWPKEMVSFTSDSLLDAAPLEDVIYLSPDSDNVCMELNPSKSYVVGCFIDHNSMKGATRAFADSHGIRTERLPIAEFISIDGGNVLTINQVVEILVRVANGATWKEALLQTIPGRKNPKQLNED